MHHTTQHIPNLRHYLSAQRQQLPTSRNFRTPYYSVEHNQVLNSFRVNLNHFQYFNRHLQVRPMVHFELNNVSHNINRSQFLLNISRSTSIIRIRINRRRNISLVQLVANNLRILQGRPNNNTSTLPYPNVSRSRLLTNISRGHVRHHLRTQHFGQAPHRRHTSLTLNRTFRRFQQRIIMTIGRHHSFMVTCHRAGMAQRLDTSLHQHHHRQEHKYRHGHRTRYTGRGVPRTFAFSMPRGDNRQNAPRITRLTLLERQPAYDSILD